MAACCGDGSVCTAGAGGWRCGRAAGAARFAGGVADEASVARACAAAARWAGTASKVRRVDSGILKRLGAGTGRAAAVPAGGNVVCRGHRAAGGKGTPRPRRAPCAPRSLVCQSRLDSAGAGSAAGRHKQISESSASARSPPSPTADAAAIAAARSASPAARRSPARHGRCDSRAPSARAGSSAAPPRCAAGCRAAAGCPCPWPRAAGSRDRRPRSAETWRQSSAGKSALQIWMPLRRADSPRRRRRAAGRECGRTARARGAVAERRGHRRDAVVDLLPRRVRSASGACSSGWFWLWVPTVWPASRSLRTPSGLALACAADHEEGRLDALRRRGSPGSGCCISAADRRRRSAPPRGPPAAASRRYCMVPMRGCSRGSTTSVREVPSASGWPGQSAADAACAANRRQAAPGTRRSMTASEHQRYATDHEPRLHSTSTATAYISRRHERGLHRMTSTPTLWHSDVIRPRTACSRTFGINVRRTRFVAPAGTIGPRDSRCRADSAGRPAAWRRSAPWGRAAG